MTTKGIFPTWMSEIFPDLKPSINKHHFCPTPMSTESMQNPCGAGVFVIGATSHVRIRISTTSHHTHMCNEIEGSYDKKSISPLHTYNNTKNNKLVIFLA